MCTLAHEHFADVLQVGLIWHLSEPLNAGDLGYKWNTKTSQFICPSKAPVGHYVTSSKLGTLDKFNRIQGNELIW